MTDQIMAESKTKKSGLLRRTPWGLWVILLSGLLLVCLIFAAPWKVITLIAIFLAAATILRRVYRKWFWLGVGVVVLAITAWIFLPDDNKNWRPYTFDKELAQLQARYAVPDSENAAIIYEQILANWKQKEANEPNLPRDWQSIALKGFWLSKDQPEITVYVRYHQDTIKQLVEASKFERCSFPIISDIVITNEQLDRLPAMRKSAYLLIAAGNNALAEEDNNKAFEKYLTALRIGQHLSQQPSITDVLIGIAIETLSLQAINRFIVLGDANEPYLTKLEQALSAIKHDWNSDLPGFLDSDKLIFKNMMSWIFYEVNSKGRVRFGRDPMAKVREQTPKELANDTNDFPEFFSSYWFKKFMKANSILYWFYVPAAPEELGRIIDASYEKNYMMTKPDFDWSKEPHNTPSKLKFKLNFRYLADLIAQLNRGSYPGLHSIYLQAQAQQRAAQLILALRRYKNTNGQWPQQLEDINDIAQAEAFIDPINNDVFVYNRTEENFTLYSKGKNGIDDGGKRDRDTKDKGGPDDILIWPSKNSECK